MNSLNKHIVTFHLINHFVVLFLIANRPHDFFNAQINFFYKKPSWHYWWNLRPNHISWQTLLDIGSFARITAWILKILKRNFSFSAVIFFLVRASHFKSNFYNLFNTHNSTKHNRTELTMRLTNGKLFFSIIILKFSLCISEALILR